MILLVLLLIDIQVNRTCKHVLMYYFYWKSIPTAYFWHYCWWLLLGASQNYYYWHVFSQKYWYWFRCSILVSSVQCLLAITDNSNSVHCNVAYLYSKYSIPAEWELKPTVPWPMTNVNPKRLIVIHWCYTSGLRRARAPARAHAPVMRARGRAHHARACANSRAPCASVRELARMLAWRRPDV